MKGLFLDASPTMLAKNLLPIANYFKEQIDDFDAVFISVEASSNVDYNLDSQKKTELSINNRFLEFRSFNIKRIRKFLKSERPDFIFFDAFRIYDQIWIGISNELGIKSFKLQHGFEIDSVHYKPLAIFTKFKKGLRFTYAAYNLARLLKVNPLRLYAQYFIYIFKGTSLKQSHLSNPKLHPSKVFVFSDYYKQFWNNKFGFVFDSMVNITPYDFLIVNNLLDKEINDSCCYITQTLVEDGRMKKRNFISLMQAYIPLIKSIKKFIIKLHPRADVSLYEMFEQFENVEIIRDFPRCKSYITHYSSMAFTAAFLSNKVIIHELDGHPTPDIFNYVTDYITKDIEKIIDYLKDTNSSSTPDLDAKKQELEPYAIYDDIHPTTKIYQTIIETLN